MRDPQITGYSPRLTPGVTPDDKITANSRNVPCDGGGGALGHPMVMLHIEHDQATCPYCSRTYVLAEGAGDDHGH